MLTEQPNFTYRIEAKGLRYQAKINGIIIHEDLDAKQIATEEPVNHFMISGKNRISINLYPWETARYNSGKISVSLYVNRYGDSEANKVLIAQIAFDSNNLIGDEAEAINNQQGISLSLPAGKFNSQKRFERDDKLGDVITHLAKIEHKNALIEGTYLYQDVEIEVPFPRWGYLDASPIDFPDSFEEFRADGNHYLENLIKPLYEVHKKLFEQLKSGDVDGFASHFEERIREMSVALYSDEVTLMEMFKQDLQDDLNHPRKDLKFEEITYARPYVSDNKNLIKLSGGSMIYFEDQENSIFSLYPIWFYQKDGKWIISR